MKVIERKTAKFDNDSYVLYTFNTGNQYRVWNSGSEVGYTRSGNYTNQITLAKLRKTASEYEDRRIQTA